MATALNTLTGESLAILSANFDTSESFESMDTTPADVEQPKKRAQRASAAKQKAATACSAKLSRRDRVVLEHLPLVKAIAVRVHENLPVHVDLDDLIHAGVLGLFDAATKYDPEKQVAFSSYAKHRIKGAILDSLRQLDWASRDLRRRHKQVEAATRDLAAELQRSPTEAEVATRLNIDVDRWRQMMMELRNVGLISANTRATEHEDLPAPEYPSAPETQPDHMCAREQLRFVLDKAMTTLPDRYKQVVVLYYTNEMTMKEIGGVLGINESRVSQIHKSALEKMNVALHLIGGCWPAREDGQANSEYASGSGLTDSRELSLMRFDNASADCESQSRPAIRSRSRLVDSIKTVEDQRKIILGNPLAGVRHHQAGYSILHARRHTNQARVLIKLNRICE
jgi:RNA polymerase sigma factor FliA